MRNSATTIEIRLPQEAPGWPARAALWGAIAVLAAELYGIAHALAGILGRLH